MLNARLVLTPPLLTIAVAVLGACLRSNDNGTTWHDHAISEAFRQPYAIGGCREITPDGWIIGSFTDVTGETKNDAPEGRVHFFRIKVK